jgi:7-keto-8-aminopelargonate synthetase-like enzyme
MSTFEKRLCRLDQMVSAGAADGLGLRTPDDVPLDGRTLRFDGRSVLNFGSCGYLGLEFDPRLRAGVCEAVRRYGTQFSSSRIYVQAPPYVELEHCVGEMFGGHALVVPSTTLGHVAALPVLVGSQDAVIVDQQVHQSVQMAVDHLRCQGTLVEVIHHSDVNQLEAALARHAGYARIWYLADGVYSMYGDIAPLGQLGALLQREERLHLYIDDSHGVGWAGRHGRGPTLDRLGSHERLVVAAGFAKSFAAGGAAIVFPDAELKRRVRAVGGPMIFSGPLQPPMLGAALASARIHLSTELPGLQRALRERIDLCTRLLAQHSIALASNDGTPICFVPIGSPVLARQVARGLLDEGFFTNAATYPAVPLRQAGVRFMLTLHHRPSDIERLVAALSSQLRHVLDTAEAGAGSPQRRPGRQAVSAPS